MNILAFHNTAHLGDCVYQIHYLNKLVEKYEDIKIFFHCNDSYHYQLNEFIIKKENIKLSSLNNIPESSIDCWIARDVPGKREMLDRLNEDGLNDVFYVSFFKGLSTLIGLESPIKEPKDMLIHNQDLLKENKLSGEIDFLFINSVPMSGQFKDFDAKRLGDVVCKVKEMGSVITTAPNSCNAPCTLDYNLTLMEIGNLSIKAKKIIAVNTSPTIACFNIFNIDNFEKFLVLENNIRFSFNDRIKNINKIENILKNL